MVQNKTKAQLQAELDEVKAQLEALQAQDWHHERQAAVLDSIDEVIYVSDPDSYELLYVNEGFKKIWGDRVGDMCYNILQNRDAPCPFCTNDRILARPGETYIWEFQNEVSGSWFRCIDRAIPWPDGRTVRYEMAIDITKQKQAETELQRMRAVLDSTTDLVAITDLKGRIRYVNDAGLEMIGRQGQDPTTLTIGDFHPAEMGPEIMEQHVPAVMDDGVHTWQSVVQHVDGSTIPVSQVGILLVDPEGKPESMATVMRDISEQKQTEDQLRENQELLQTFLDNLPDIAFVKDLDGHVILHNRKLAEFFGRGESSLVGKTVYDLTPPEIADGIWASEREIMASGQTVEMEEVVPQGDEMRVKLTTKFPLFDAEGQTRALGGISVDITERKQAEAERQALQQEVIEAQQRAIQELSTPIIPVMETQQGGVIVMPLIGSIDTMRARDITRTLLAGINQHRAKIVILDVTGVPLVDSGVANHLNKTIQAARLKGARTIVTGISDAVAETVVDLGIDWSDMETLSDLQTGLVAALRSLGLKLARS